MAAKIPVTVITGFLGSGKTTLIRHLLENNHGARLAVLVNEFGELGIDGELLKSCPDCPEENIVELTNGCLCCTVQEEFLPTMQKLLERRNQIDRILIETSGLALPKPLVQAFRWEGIRNATTVDGVITVVDCAAVAGGTFASDPEALAIQRSQDAEIEHETPIQELFEDQLVCADAVVMNKTDLVDAATLSEVERLVRAEIPAAVKILHATQGVVLPEIILGMQAAVEDHLDRRPSHHDNEEEHEHDDDIHAIVLQFTRSFAPDCLLEALAELVATHEIYRIKGFVDVAGKPMRLVVQGVGKRFDRYFDRPWQGTRETQLVLIGKDLSEPAIRDRLAQVPEA